MEGIRLFCIRAIKDQRLPVSNFDSYPEVLWFVEIDWVAQCEIPLPLVASSPVPPGPHCF
jgi:hypothetical protein